MTRAPPAPAHPSTLDVRDHRGLDRSVWKIGDDIVASTTSSLTCVSGSSIGASRIATDLIVDLSRLDVNHLETAHPFTHGPWTTRGQPHPCRWTTRPRSVDDPAPSVEISPPSVDRPKHHM